MQTCYIEKMDKPMPILRKIRFTEDNCQVYFNMEKDKYIKKLIKVLKKKEISKVVLSKDFIKNKNLINALNANDIFIFDGKWLISYLVIPILDYIIKKEDKKIEETEIAITTNEISDTAIEIIKKLAKQYKKTTIVTNHLEKLRKIEKEIYAQNGILLVMSNNKKKSLAKANIILNLDFSKEVLNKYIINENAVIINIEGDMKIENKRFNGININDYEIEVGREEIIWRENFKKFRQKDLLEAVLYMRDNYQNICSKIGKYKVNIAMLYGVNGKI